MKKIQRICWLLVALCLCLSCSFPAAAQPEQSMDTFEGCSTLDAQACLAGDQQLLDTASAVMLYELGSGTLVYSWNPDLLVDPSGMNKIMTALLAVEQGDPDSTVIVSNAALSSLEPGALTAGLASGEEIKLRDLLYCMMVGSANDAAAVIAEYIAGGQAAFVEMMNQKAQELGCSNTMFMNPSGLSHENQYTTARDLAKITAAALELEEFREYFCAASYTVPATNKSQERNLVTTNFMMSKETVSNFLDERVTGGKTGAFTTTDRSLICTAESGDVQYLSVVMSAQGTKGGTLSLYANFKETGVLLNYGFDNYSLRRLLTTDQVLARFEVIDGENDVAVASASAVHVMMPKEMNASDLTYRCIKTDSGVSAPISTGQCVGTVQVWYGSLCVSQSDLVAMHSVEQPGVHNISLPTTAGSDTDGTLKNTVLVVLIVLLVLALLLGGFVLIRSTLRGKTVKKGTKKKERERR